MSNHIAFIGVGNMGNPMAHQLVKAGKNVKVFDVSPNVIEIAKQSGLNVINSMDISATIMKTCSITLFRR